MPHGLTIDHEDNLWVTDVALHQIFKYPPLAVLNEKVTEPLIVKGERFVNGKDDYHFCKPSAVAVLRNGDFFVTDGYCNSRIIKFNKEGSRLLTLGRSSFSGKMALIILFYSTRDSILNLCYISCRYLWSQAHTISI